MCMWCVSDVGLCVDFWADVFVGHTLLLYVTCHQGAPTDYSSVCICAGSTPVIPWVTVRGPAQTAGLGGHHAGLPKVIGMQHTPIK